MRSHTSSLQGQAGGDGPRAASRPGRAFVARLLVTVALLGLLASRIDPAIVTLRLVALDAGWIAAAFVVVFAAVALSAWKWGLILHSLGRTLPFVRLVRHYVVGLFFNNVLPTTVGGDAVRAWETTRDTGEVPDATGSVVAERLIAGAALGITSLVGLPFIESGERFLGYAVVFLVIDLALVLLFVVPRVAEGVVRGLLPRRLGALRGGVEATLARVRRVLRTPRLLAAVLLASIAFQVLVAAVNHCLFAAMGVPVSLAHCIVFTPMIFTVTMLPVSISGFGVREAAYWHFFVQAGASREEAVLASLAFFVVVGVASLPGGVLFLIGRGVRLSSLALRVLRAPLEVARLLRKRWHRVRDVDAAAARTLIDEDAALLLDVREPRECETWRIAGARAIPLGELADRVDEIADHREGPIVVYCLGGVRSAQACWMLQRRGFTRAYNLNGGILEWRDAGYPIER